jgi:hypothetical protein
MKRVAVVALLVLALAGCAVPGQTLSPGTAYAHDGAEVSNAYIDAIYQAWSIETQGAILPNRRNVMTLDAAREPAVALAIEAVPDSAPTFTQENAESIAKQWYAVKGVTEDPSPAVVESAQGAYAVFVLAYADPTMALVRQLGEELEASIDGSPRAGTFDADAFVASVELAMKNADDEGLQQFGFAAFYRINGFVVPPSDARVYAPAPGAAQD